MTLTGVELAGLILAAIPLLISAAEHHRIGIAPVDGLIFRARERRRLTESLENHRYLFKYCCSQLLSIAEIENPGDLLADGAAARWKDADIRRRLEHALGEDFGIFERQIGKIDDIVKRLQHMLHSSRISFALLSLSRNEHVHDLGIKILELKRLIKGAHYNRNLRVINQDDSKILRIQALRRERASLYKCITASWGCDCKDAHSVNLSLFHKAGDGGGLSLLFLSQPDSQESSNAQAPLPWSWKLVAVQSILTDTNNLTNISQGSCENAFTDRLARPCHHLCRILQDSSQSTSTIGDTPGLSSLPLALLRDNDGFEHDLRLDKKLETEPDLISLHNALELSSALPNVGSASWFVLKDRIELAAALVHAVLQNHALPWLPETWTSQDVFFLRGSEGLSRDTFRKPYFRAPKSRTSTDQGQTGHFPLIANMTLFNLAIVLIEIAYKAPLEDLLTQDERQDCENPRGRMYAIPLAASRLISGIQDHVVIPSYYEVARRCLRGDFGELEFHEKDLGNDAFLLKVYDHAVKPLENYLHEFVCRQK